MAKPKPLDQLSPAYRKRIERGLAAGKSRQEARGHGAGEGIHTVRNAPQPQSKFDGVTVGVHPESSGARYKGGRGASSADIIKALRRAPPGRVHLAAYGRFYKAQGRIEFRWVSVVGGRDNLIDFVQSQIDEGRNEQEIAVELFSLTEEPEVITQWSVGWPRSSV